jgi:hypothetical protein
MEGRGTLGSLHQAMARDSSGKLQALVTQYTTQTDAGSRDALLQNILYHWAGAQDVDPASRANNRHSGNAIGDARKLEFMEEYFGRDYLGTWCWGDRDPNPHGPASVKLLALYEDIKAGFAARLDRREPMSLTGGLDDEPFATASNDNTWRITA